MNENDEEILVAALAQAKWNESVYVKVTNDENQNGDDDDDDDDGNKNKKKKQKNHDLLVVPQLDRLNGGVKWVNILVQEDAKSSSSTNSTSSTSSMMMTSTNEDNADDDDDDAIDKRVLEHHLRTKIWIFPMLNDARRNRMYETAIQRASQHVIANQMNNNRQMMVGNDNTVLQTLDIGSGTGLLAMLSAKFLSQEISKLQQQQKQHQHQHQQQHQQKKKQNDTTLVLDTLQISSFEMASPMATLAQRIVALNMKNYVHESKEGKEETNVEVCVKVKEGHSCQVPPMNQNANHRNTEGTTEGAAMLCTSELLESGLLGEGWLPAMRDAWQRHLHPRAVVVPQQARIYAQLLGRRNTGSSASSSSVPPSAGLSNFVGPSRVLEMGRGKPHLRLFTTTDTSGMLSDPGNGYDPRTGKKYGSQVDIHAAHFLKQNPAIHLLSKPMEVLDFDVTHPSKIPSINPLE